MWDLPSVMAMFNPQSGAPGGQLAKWESGRTKWLTKLSLLLFVTNAQYLMVNSC